tara:strand:+ start:40 stop:312 length:273 start_codon:yes stop_codon:yes gene_type:complete
MDKKHITFLAIFLAIALVLVSTLLVFSLNNNEDPLTGQAIEIEEELIPFTAEDLEGIESPGEMFSLFDLDNNAVLSYEEFKMAIEVIIQK